MDLTLVTWNIRCVTHLDAGEHAWEARRPRVVAMLRLMDPDVAGLQEVLPEQRRDLEAAFPDYRFLGGGRDADGSGEAVPLMLRRDLVQVQESGEFWLSRRPEERGSLGWDAFLPRHCTWARLSGGLTLFNTHLDHVGARSRREAAGLILGRVGARSVVCGDMNEAEDGHAVRRLSATLADTWRRRHPEGPSHPTWHDFGRDPGGDRIDYVFASPDLEVLEAEIVAGPPDASDHHPVTVRLRVP